MGHGTGDQVWLGPGLRSGRISCSCLSRLEETVSLGFLGVDISGQLSCGGSLFGDLLTSPASCLGTSQCFATLS